MALIVAIVEINDCYYTLYEFFTPALVDGISLECIWQQVSSDLKDTSQYSG